MIESTCDFETKPLNDYGDVPYCAEGSLKVTRRTPGMIEIALRVEDKFVTFNIMSEDYLKLRVLESSIEFLDLGLKF